MSIKSLPKCISSIEYHVITVTARFHLLLCFSAEKFVHRTCERHVDPILRHDHCVIRVKRISTEE